LTIVPDDKDWTWVLERPCPECRFDASSVPREDIAGLIGTTAQEWAAILEEPSAVLRTRSRTDRWAPLEYACHVRDVFRLYEERLQLMLTQDFPLFPNWDQDAAAVEDRYIDQHVAAVSAQLRQAAAVLALSFAGVSGATWLRRGSRSDGATFNVETFGRYMIHDPIHHVHDVRADLAARS
jgi:DinB family protein